MSAQDARSAILHDNHDRQRRADLMSPMLDEIYVLRGESALAALELSIVLSSLPKSTGKMARAMVEKTIERLERNACGVKPEPRSYSRSLAHAGAKTTLTRADYEKELGWTALSS